MVQVATRRIVELCVRHRAIVAVVGILLALAAGSYDVARFSINTDSESLISADVPWHRRQLDFYNTFPQYGTLAVVRAGTPEAAEQATEALAQELARQRD